MVANQPARKTIAIVGGGVSGVLTALHLTVQHADARIVLIDARPEVGLGLAYSTQSFLHLLNVPAGKISALPTEPDHFLKWLRAHHDPAATCDTFAPRAVFGLYIRSLFAKATGIEHLQTCVTDLRQTGGGYTLTLHDGRHLACDFVVLATGNFDPAMLPGICEKAVATNAYCHNAWVGRAYDDLPKDAPVTLIGTGLTSVDVLQRLREIGHRGVVTAVSLNGEFPNRHASYTPMARPAIRPGTPATCKAYLRELHLAIKSGVEWRAAIDSLRCITNDLWLALPREEKLRFRRHLQSRWDVTRHRMAPQIAEFIDREVAAGTLVIRKCKLQSVECAGAGAKVAICTPRGVESFETARVINCTGPSLNYRRVNSPLLNSLFQQNLIAPGPLGGGYNTDRHGALIDEQGKASKSMFTLGPGRLGTLFESIAIPEIRNQAVELAATLTAMVGKTGSNGHSHPFPTTVRPAALAVQ